MSDTELRFRMRGRTYRAVLVRDHAVGGFTVTVPELPGVVTEADSISEARRNVREATALWLDAQGHP